MFINYEDDFGAALCIETKSIGAVTINPPMGATEGRISCWNVHIFYLQQGEKPIQTLFYQKKNDAKSVYDTLQEIARNGFLCSKHIGK